MKINNDILIVQAGTGSNQIGRFDLTVNRETNSIVEWRWQLAPIDNRLTTPDVDFQDFINSFQQVIDHQ